MDKQQKGKHGEMIAIDHIKRSGLRVVESNYYTRFGEIDIIAKCDNVYHFIEVKTRLTNQLGTAVESLTRSKINSFVKTVQSYIKRNNLKALEYSLDLIAIDISNDGTIDIEWIKNITM